MGKELELFEVKSGGSPYRLILNTSAGSFNLTQGSKSHCMGISEEIERDIIKHVMTLNSEIVCDGCLGKINPSSTYSQNEEGVTFCENCSSLDPVS